MQGGPFGAILWVVVIVVVAFLLTRQRRRRHRIGSAAMGTVYDFLNEDKQHAVEIIVEGRAEARDPEDRDGNLPELEQPKRP